MAYAGGVGASLPRRAFLCGPAFQSRHVTLTVAPAGVGKTSLTVAEAVHLAAGRELFAPIAAPTKVWLFNGEESRDELERRIAGTIEAHGLDRELVARNLYFNSGRSHPILLAEAGSRGMEIHTPRADHLIAVIKELGIKAMIVDPFVSTHAIQENNNAAIDKVSKLWARIADEADCAIHLVHHTRKTGREELTAESVRGA
jgi:RecA-family ATPase